MNIDTEKKMYEMSLYTNIIPKMVDTSQIKINNKKSKKDEKSINSDVNNRIKRKASVLNYQQRSLQERMSLIQSKELQIKELEETLEQVKSSYSQSLNKSKKRSDKEKIKIKTLSKKLSELQSNKKNSEKSFEYEEKVITEKEKIILVINDALRKIGKIKNDLNIHKSKLISLENELKKGECKIDKSKSHLKEDCIINLLDFICIEGDIQTGIIINIYV
ncbi:hypothetical protein [Paraclostridium bifermentans]|uniref:hypothetical protein n=3 Tax=Paraclostridium bifermentans TaxID=1490 RepID=UPI00115811F0|nr:hypothetical protein [Paraclostridium bifermentans]TQO58833.1 hypothetical protein D5S05_04205 [Paraclostridium bifermentans]GKZ01626.1 hypothetical protein ANS014_00600 [Paraclostridium bifermentans]GKZ07849.1 hypothetical protein ANS015_27320 [Paraclostridium bifermentans]GKZ09876.1 hypothetical protein ANS017_12600 [Paraclostridium bifermentans]